MCTVNLKVNDAMVKRINPQLTNRESIGQWVQKIFDEMIADMAVDVAAPSHDMSVEELYHAIEEDVKAIYAE